MPKRNVSAKSGKQLYLNNSFNKGILYTSSEIPEGYTKLLDNFDVTPSGDAITPRDPFKLNSDSIVVKSKYTYPLTFQSAPDKQFYINFPNTITEQEFINNDVLTNINANTFNDTPFNVFYRNNNALNNLNGSTDIIESFANNTAYDPTTTIVRDHIGIQTIASQSRNVFRISNFANTEHPLFNSFSYIYDDTDIPNDYSDITLSSSYVIDADTIVLNNHKYRLANINAPEYNYKWNIFGKKFLEYILYVFTNDDNDYYKGDFYIKSFGTDNYGRTIVDIYIQYTSHKLISLSQLILSAGFAKLDYINNQVINYSDMVYTEQYAKDNLHKIWNTNESDPFSNYLNYNIIFKNIKDEDEHNISNTDLTLALVKIKSDKRINYNVINNIDKIDLKYIEYLDSYAAIGVVYYNNAGTISVYYKGLLYINLEVDEDYNMYYFNITLPTNNLEGAVVDTIDASTNGYNLLNSIHINTDPSNKPSLPLTIRGILPVDPLNENVIITSAIKDYNVRFKAIINDTRYIVDDPKPFTNIYLDYSLGGDTKQILLEGNKCNITQTLVNTSMNNIVQPEANLEILGFTYEYKDFYNNFELNKKSYNASNITVSQDVSDPENSRTTQTVQIYTDKNIIISCVGFNIYNVYWQITFDDFYLNPIYTGSKTLTLYKKWSIADASYTSDQNSFTDLDSFSEAYSVNLTTGELSPHVSNINYKDINVYNNIIVKYTLQPVYHILIGTSITGPHIYYAYENQAIYSVYTGLKVGDVVETLSDEDLTKNINIKDATRVDVFNNQVCLYGPGLKTNTLFFSKFEQPWYFSYPFNAVDIKDKIVYIYNWNNNLIIFGQQHIWVLSSDGSVTESTVKLAYENLSITDTDIDLISTFGQNLIFFSNNVGYIMTPNRYYNDPAYNQVYKLTDAINNLLSDPRYLFKSLCNDVTDSIFTTGILECTPKLYVYNDYINILQCMIYGNNKIFLIYRYNQLYKYWTTYSIVNSNIDFISSVYTCEPNIGKQYVCTTKEVVDNNTIFKFKILYKDVRDKIKKDFGTQNIITTLDTGFLSIDPLNDKRFKMFILDFNNIEKNNIINIYINFFIDGNPIILTDDNNTSDYEITNNTISFNEGNYTFKYTYNYSPDDESQRPYGYLIDEEQFDIKVQGRNQIGIPLFGKGRLPSFVIKTDTDKLYTIVGYSIIYKEKNINIRRP